MFYIYAVFFNFVYFSLLKVFYAGHGNFCFCKHTKLFLLFNCYFRYMQDVSTDGSREFGDVSRQCPKAYRVLKSHCVSVHIVFFKVKRAFVLEGKQSPSYTA